MKKHLISIGLCIVILVVVLLMFHFVGPFMDVITSGMTSWESNSIMAIIVVSPIIAGHFLIKFIKEKYRERDK